MTEGRKNEEITIAHADLGARRGVLVVIREIGPAKVQGGKVATPVYLEALSNFRVERQWNRGKSKEVLVHRSNREHALGFLAGVVAGVKLANA